MKLKSYKSTVGACCVGYMSSAVANNIAPVFFIIFQTRFGIDDERLSLLIFINFAIQFIMDSVSAKFVDKIGYRPSAVAANIFVSSGLVCMGVLPLLLADKFAAVLVSVAVYAVGAGILEVIVSPIVEYSTEGKSGGAISFLHSFYCWGQMLVILCSTLLLGFFGEDFWNVIPIIWAVLPFVNIFLFAVVPLSAPVAEDERKSFKSMLTSKTFILILLMMTFAGATELSMSQWSSLFAEKALGVEKMVGDIAGPCLFALTMGTGRVLYSLFGEKYDLSRLLIIASVGCSVCYFTVALSPIPYLSLAACALTGFFVSIMWTGMLNISAERYPNGGTGMFGLLALFGDVGCALGPCLSGIVSDFTESTGLADVGGGLKIGLGTSAVFPLLMLVCLFAFVKKTSKNRTVKTT